MSRNKHIPKAKIARFRVHQTTATVENSVERVAGNAVGTTAGFKTVKTTVERVVRAVTGPRRELYPEETGVFIGDLDPAVTEEELRTIFQRFGRVRKVLRGWDKRPGIPTKYAVLFLESAEQANAALDALYGFKLHQREIRVNRFRAKPPRGVAHKAWR